MTDKIQEVQEWLAALKADTKRGNDILSKTGMGGVAGAVVAIQAAANNKTESVADIARHDQDHHNWHAMHGDPPCKSEADCASMRAKYKDEDTTTKSKKDSDMTDIHSEIAALKADTQQVRKTLEALDDVIAKGGPGSGPHAGGGSDASREKSAAANSASENAKNVSERVGNGYINHSNASVAHHDAGMAHLDAALEAGKTGNYAEAQAHGNTAASHFQEATNHLNAPAS
jgi:hypothetical protein